MVSEAAGDIVKRARKAKGLTQSEFGREIDRPQSVVSKYERGLVEPPGNVVMHCMNILGARKSDVSPNEVAHLIRSRLSSPEHAPLRVALAEFIESVPSRRPTGSR